jgi:mono/diheme cytochrome c family protein
MVIAVCLLFLGLSFGATLAGEAPQTFSRPEKAKLAGVVKDIFKNKCAKCHGPQGVRETEKPKGDFDYILDLAKLVSNPKLIVPGDPEDSKLYNMVADLLMPDDTAGEQPLPHKEIQLIRRWIMAGAPTENGTAAAMKFNCRTTKKYTSKVASTSEELERNQFSTRIEELPQGIFIDRCSFSHNAGKVNCLRQKVDRIEFNRELKIKKFYVFSSQFNFQLFPDLSSLTDDGLGGVQYGICEYMSR